MNITPENRQVKPEKWARYRYNLTTNLGADGERLTGCDAHIALSRKVAAEGMVLLKNDGTLPLKTGTTVALFGVGTLEYIQCGGGSGEVYPAYVRNVYEGFSLKEPRVRIFEPVSRFYYDYAAPLVAVQEPGSILPEPAVPAELIADAAANADVAIIAGAAKMQGVCQGDELFYQFNIHTASCA